MDDQQAAELGQFIQQARAAKELSGRQLAELVGVNQSSIIRIEAGKFSAPSPDILKRIAGALDLNTLEILQRAGYSDAGDLPAMPLYLRSKYANLPPEAAEKIERHARRIARQHGINIDGPAPGEDEN